MMVRTMNERSSRDAVTSVFDVLEAEGHAITLGDLDGVAMMDDEKEILIEQIGVEYIAEHAMLLQLQEHLTSNQALLQSALDGIKSVSERMAFLKKVRRGLETYDRSGRKNAAKFGGGGTLEKRA